MLLTVFDEVGFQGFLNIIFEVLDHGKKFYGIQHLKVYIEAPYFVRKFENFGNFIVLDVRKGTQFPLSF